MLWGLWGEPMIYLAVWFPILPMLLLLVGGVSIGSVIISLISSGAVSLPSFNGLILYWSFFYTTPPNVLYCSRELRMFLFPYPLSFPILISISLAAFLADGALSKNFLKFIGELDSLVLIYVFFFFSCWILRSMEVCELKLLIVLRDTLFSLVSWWSLGVPWMMFSPALL